MRALIVLFLAMSLLFVVGKSFADKDGKHRRHGRDETCVVVLPPQNAAQQFLADVATAMQRIDPAVVTPEQEQEVECHESK